MIDRAFHDRTQAKKSLERCLKNPRFLDRFYEVFFASSQEIRAKFLHTRLPNQKIMLKASLHIMLMMAAGRMQHSSQLEQLAKRHGPSDLAIRPEWYTNWIDSMLVAARETDPLFSADVERCWRAALQPGVEFFKSYS
jgi:hypothetical protein